PVADVPVVPEPLADGADAPDPDDPPLAAWPPLAGMNACRAVPPPPQPISMSPMVSSPHNTATLNLDTGKLLRFISRSTGWELCWTGAICDQRCDQTNVANTRES